MKQLLRLPIGKKGQKYGEERTGGGGAGGQGMNSQHQGQGLKTLYILIAYFPQRAAQIIWSILFFVVSPLVFLPPPLVKILVSENAEDENIRKLRISLLRSSV